MAQPPQSDAQKVVALRELMPATGAGIYLDTATAGPLPAESATAMHEAEEWELRVGRAAAGREEDLVQRESEARAVLAALIGDDPATVLPMAGVGQALLTGLLALDWRPGERLLASAENDMALLASARVAGRALGVALDVVPEVALDSLPPGTRRVLLPAVSPISGRRLPLQEISADLHRQAAGLIVDGSLIVAAAPFSVAESGAEMVVLAADRWALGPEGTAALWLAPTASLDGELPAGELPRTALPRTALLGLARSVGWLEMYVGLEWAYARTAALARWLADELARVEGVALLTPTDALAGIVSFRLPPAWTVEEAADELGRRVFAIVRALPAQSAIRVSVAWFKTEEELARFVGAVQELARHTPDSLPRRPSLTVL
ncbi:aminotransferase class V-fold PLP-dependent enzyme [soil metagenome]